MKKKLMMVALLLGGLTLGACVDDNESASVTAVRNAKAEQLKAATELDKARAQAELIAANAEAALKAAQAAYQEAMAALNEANAEKQAILNEKAKATLEVEIAAAKAAAEAQLMQAQAALERAKADLIKAGDQAGTATKDKIAKLVESANAVLTGEAYTWTYSPGYYNDYGNYTSGSWSSTWVAAGNSLMGDQYNKGLKPKLIDLKANRIAAEANLENTKALIAQNIEQKQIELAQKQALLKAYEENKNTSREDAQAQYDEANQKFQALIKVKDEATAANNLVDESVTGSTIDKAKTAVKATEIANFAQNNLFVANENLWKSETLDAEKYTVVYDDGTAEDKTKNYTETKIVPDLDAIAAAVKNAEREVTIKEAKLATAKETYETNMAATNVTYKGYKDAVTAAQTAFDADPTDAKKQTLTNAENALKNYEDTEAGKVKAAQDAVDAAQENVEKYKEVQTLSTGDAYKTYEEVYEKYVTAVKESIDTYTAYLKATHNYQQQNALIISLNNVINGLTDWTSLINTVENDIRTIEQAIASMTDNYGYTEETRLAYIDVIDTDIAAAEARIELLEAMYEDYLAQIKELIGEDEAEDEAAAE